MGTIKATKVTSNNKIEYQIIVDYEESLINKGKITNAHVFSEDAADSKTKIILKGSGRGTKYIKIPRNLSTDIDTMKPAACMRIDSNDKTIIITVIDKW